MDLLSVLITLCVICVESQYARTKISSFCDDYEFIDAGVNTIEVPYSSLFDDPGYGYCYIFNVTREVLEPTGFILVQYNWVALNYTTPVEPIIDVGRVEIWGTSSYSTTGMMDLNKTSQNVFGGENDLVHFVVVCDNCTGPGSMFFEITIDVIEKSQHAIDNCESCVASGNVWCSRMEGCADWGDRKMLGSDAQYPIDYFYQCGNNIYIQYVRPDMISSCSGEFSYAPPKSDIVGEEALPSVSGHFLSIANEYRKSLNYSRIFKAPTGVQSIFDDFATQVITSSEMETRFTELGMDDAVYVRNSVVTYTIEQYTGWELAQYAWYGYLNSNSMPEELTWVLTSKHTTSPFLHMMLVSNVANPEQYYDTVASGCANSTTTLLNAVCSNGLWIVPSVVSEGVLDVSTEGFLIEGDLTLSSTSNLNIAIAAGNSGKIIVEGCANLSGSLDVEIDASIEEGQIDLMEYRCLNGEFDSIQLSNNDCISSEQIYTETSFSLLFSFTCNESNILTRSILFALILATSIN